jgi:hypothetical protein
LGNHHGKTDDFLTYPFKMGKYQPIEKPWICLTNRAKPGTGLGEFTRMLLSLFHGLLDPVQAPADVIAWAGIPRIKYPVLRAKIRHSPYSPERVRMIGIKHGGAAYAKYAT